MGRRKGKRSRTGRNRRRGIKGSRNGRRRGIRRSRLGTPRSRRRRRTVCSSTIRSSGNAALLTTTLEKGSPGLLSCIFNCLGCSSNVQPGRSVRAKRLHEIISQRVANRLGREKAIKETSFPEKFSFWDKTGTGSLNRNELRNLLTFIDSTTPLGTSPSDDELDYIYTSVKNKFNIDTNMYNNTPRNGITVNEQIQKEDIVTVVAHYFEYALRRSTIVALVRKHTSDQTYTYSNNSNTASGSFVQMNDYQLFYLLNDLIGNVDASEWEAHCNRERGRPLQLQYDSNNFTPSAPAMADNTSNYLPSAPPFISHRSPVGANEMIPLTMATILEQNECRMLEEGEEDDDDEDDNEDHQIIPASVPISSIPIAEKVTNATHSTSKCQTYSYGGQSYSQTPSSQTSHHAQHPLVSVVLARDVIALDEWYNNLIGIDDLMTEQSLRTTIHIDRQSNGESTGNPQNYYDQLNVNNRIANRVREESQRYEEVGQILETIDRQLENALAIIDKGEVDFTDIVQIRKKASYESIDNSNNDIDGNGLLDTNKLYWALHSFAMEYDENCIFQSMENLGSHNQDDIDRAIESMVREAWDMSG